VLQLLQQKHVLAAAVSGAGKTRLAFDLAQRQYALYFDMKGEHGKVRQMDVWDFTERCSRTVSGGRRLPREDAVHVFDRVIAALVLSRWAVLAVAMRANGGGNLSPAQWLWMQTDNANLFDDSFISCLRLSDERQHELLGVLCTVVTPMRLRRCSSMMNISARNGALPKRGPLVIVCFNGWMSMISSVLCQAQICVLRIFACSTLLLVKVVMDAWNAGIGLTF
jgi:hypothetical protein